MSNRRSVGRIGRRSVMVEQSWSWQEAAACAGASSELFFGPEGEKQAQRDKREKRAVEICGQCPVREPCQKHAVRLPETYGVWGGTTEAGRSAPRRGRVASPAA